MNFKEALALCNTIPGSFTETNARALWNAVKTCPPNARVVEVGVDQGRSTSILMAASQPGWTLYLVDSWESVLIENKAKVERLLMRFSPAEHGKAQIIHATSVVAGEQVPKPIHFVHIDANHYTHYPSMDCEVWLPKLVSGGVAAFHDYQASFEAVTLAVDQYTKDWEVIGNFESLAVRRKP